MNRKQSVKGGHHPQGVQRQQRETEKWDEQPGLREAVLAEGAGYAIGNRADKQEGRARAAKG